MPGKPHTTQSRVLVPFLIVAVLLLCSGPVALAAPAAHTLDHFDVEQGPLLATYGNPLSSSVAGASILGGERDLSVEVTSNATGYAPVQVTGGQLLHGQMPNITARTLVQWDGVDGSMALDPIGLGGVDLTEGNTVNAFAVTSVFNDLPIDLVFTVYSGANSSTATLSLPGGQVSGSIDYYVPFAAFTTATGSGADFTSVRAVELLIDGVIPGNDLNIHEVRTDSFDWGDLPDGLQGAPDYPTLYASDGPRHVIGTLYLGAEIDEHELDGIPTVGATGDDSDGIDDEDGVVRTPGVLCEQGDGGGSVDVTVTGGPGCLSAWIDWNNNGSLVDAGENVLSNVAVNTGATTHPLTIPVDPASGTFYARFRLFAPDAGGGCSTARAPTGQAVNGEVEDYVWSFGPNAVRLQSFSGAAAPPTLPLVGIVLASAAALLAGVRRVLRG